MIVAMDANGLGGRESLLVQAAEARRLLKPAASGALIAVAGSGLAWLVHFNFAAAVSIQLLLVVVTALRGSFVLATATSLAGFVCLNYLFVPPLYRFTVADPRNWVSLLAFEAAALLVSSMSSRAREHADEAQEQRSRSVKLYELSRAILLIDGSRSVVDQLKALVKEIVGVESVDVWLLYDDAMGGAPPKPGSDVFSAANAYGSGVDQDDPAGRFAKRMLRLGTKVTGAITLQGWMVDGLIADGVASLAAVALERARAVQRETRAASERDTETLRTVVLDGLAHGFKTPLTAIRTASSGLLALGELNPTQRELVSIVDEQTDMLNRMATRLLQTAALDRSEMKLAKTAVPLLSLIRQVVLDQEFAARERMKVSGSAELMVKADARLLEQAVLQLIDNAIKYSDGGTEIRIDATLREGRACIVVENVGPAIGPEEAEMIFERFQRGSKETRQSQPGTGLGLAIVRKTAAAHHGEVWVESSDRLTRFIFMLGKE
jgi:two-component system sensor histidine kinase KdpD